MLTFVITLAWTWLGPPPTEGSPHWQWPQNAPRPPVLAAPDPALGPGRAPYVVPSTPSRPLGLGQGPER